MNVLVPCEGCRRHIRVEHASCPFCAATVPPGFAKRAIPAATRRLDRLATFTFATAMTVAACGGLDDGSSAGDPDGGGGAALRDSGARDDGGWDAAGIVPSYGGGIPVPRDASVTDGAIKRDAGTVEDDGGDMALYGLPPPPDASFLDINVQPPYGMPPIDGGN